MTGALDEVQAPQEMQRVDNFNLVTRQIQIALAGDDINYAMRLAVPLMEMLDCKPDSIQMPLLAFETLEAVIVRVYLAQGEFEKALQLLDRLQASAGPGKRAERLIEVYLLRALAYQKQNAGVPTPEAIDSFEHALVLGEPEGYALLFLDSN